VRHKRRELRLTSVVDVGVFGGLRVVAGTQRRQSEVGQLQHEPAVDDAVGALEITMRLDVAAV